MSSALSVHFLEQESRERMCKTVTESQVRLKNPKAEFLVTCNLTSLYTQGNRILNEALLTGCSWLFLKVALQLFSFQWNFLENKLKWLYLKQPKSIYLWRNAVLSDTPSFCWFKKKKKNPFIQNSRHFCKSVLTLLCCQVYSGFCILLLGFPCNSYPWFGTQNSI